MLVSEDSEVGHGCTGSEEGRGHWSWLQGQLCSRSDDRSALDAQRQWHPYRAPPLAHGVHPGPPFSPRSSSHALVFCPQTLRRGPSSGLVPSPSPDLCGAHCLVSFKSLPNVSLVSPPAPPSIGNHHPPPPPALPNPQPWFSGQTAHITHCCCRGVQSLSAGRYQL